MDLNEDSSKALSCQNKIIIKATRISWENSSKKITQPVVSPPVQNVPKPSPFNLFEFEPAPQKKQDTGSQKKVEQFDLLFPG